MAEENGAGSAEAGNSAGGDQQGAGEGAGGESTTYSPEQWREMISEEYATDASLADFKSLDDVAKSYISAQKLLGSDERVKIPTEDDSDNWMKFYNKIGRPEEAAGYDFKIPEDAPGNYESEQFQSAATDFRKTVHELGLTKDQAEKLWNYQIKSGIDQFNKQQTDHNQVLTDLEEGSKKEFGQKLPEVIKLRNNIINQYGDSEVATFLKDNPVVDRSPAILKMFEKLGKALGEDKITKEVKARTMSPKEARSKLNSMTQDKSNPLHEAYQKHNHPLHSDAVKEFNRLIKFLGDE